MIYCTSASHSNVQLLRILYASRRPTPRSCPRAISKFLEISGNVWKFLEYSTEKLVFLLAASKEERYVAESEDLPASSAFLSTSLVNPTTLCNRSVAFLLFELCYCGLLQGRGEVEERGGFPWFWPAGNLKRNCHRVFSQLNFLRF